MTTDDGRDELNDRAYAAMRAGRLAEASRDFDALLKLVPENTSYHYMRGLVHKYMLDWPVSLQHNLQAIDLADEEDEATHWNAAIAATALGDWSTARRLWETCGIAIPEGKGPIDGNYGVAVVRLHPWSAGETVFMRRIDPVRARLLNVPLPESGHRYGDIVLHDGAPTGYRLDGSGREVPVFNELERLVPSDFETFVVFIHCATPEDLPFLLEATAPGLGGVEDWTETVQYYCLRCSYGTPHSHNEAPNPTWQPDRNLGIAAQSRHTVDKLLETWARGSEGRHIDSVSTRNSAVPERGAGHAWWRGPEDDDDS
ncbi:tetratricopeptide repeat protein [Dokdonella sp. MW10]|uniref:tetratricopeptide repeat protein n=1 Tax=Dokdonella sp. MW10 TaxID=2992926 RepID=UPI003F804A03